MIEGESVGAIKVKTMIQVSTFLTLGSLALCWFTTDVQNPTIMQSAVVYPYTIIFRIGMMYSLFITFLELLFIKWWIDSFSTSKHTSIMVLFGTVGLSAYGLFVSCIDRKRIDFVLASDAVTVSAVSFTIVIALIMINLALNRSKGVALASETSWILKNIFTFAYFSAFTMGVLIYAGELSLNYKPLIQYLSVISGSLFFWTFSIDFKKFKMDVERFIKPDEASLKALSNKQ